MAHLKLSCEARAAELPAIEEALAAAGAQSLSCFDAAETPIHEPAPGETPLWPRLRIEALFSDDADPLVIEAVLRARVARFDALEFSRLEERVWEREWLRDFTCMRFGRRLWVCPDGQRPDEKDALVVDLDPGLAFGTGSHITTALCLEWLDGAVLTGRHVVDFGCGSGILAIAALKLGAERAWAVDVDPQALLATRTNAERNRVTERLEVSDATATFRSRCHVLLANILAGPLIESVARFARMVEADGVIVLSGILAEQADSVAAAYLPWFDIDPPVTRAGWSRLTGIRNRRALGRGH